MLCGVSPFPSQLVPNLLNAPPRIDIDRFRVLLAAHRDVLPREGDGGGVERCSSKRGELLLRRLQFHGRRVVNGGWPEGAFRFES